MIFPVEKIKKCAQNPTIILLYFLQKTARLFPDKLFLKLKFRLRMGNPLDLDNPSTFNEKLQWLKLNDRNPDYIRMVDKYEAKKWVAAMIGDRYLIPTLGVWNRFEEIDFAALPEKFVLKTTHDSGGVVLCMDKSAETIRAAGKKLQASLRRNYFYNSREWPYKNILPRIIAEKFVTDGTGDLRDFKFMCFNGEVKCSFVCLNRRSKEGLNVDFYDRDWKKMPFERHYHNSNISIPRPRSYEKMIEIAEKLSVGIPFVRVDLYEINDTPFFGEMTFYPGSGLEEFTPENWDRILGNWIDIHEKTASPRNRNYSRCKKKR